MYLCYNILQNCTRVLVVCPACFTLGDIVMSTTDPSDDSVLNISLSVQGDDVIIFDHIFESQFGLPTAG